MNTKKLLILAAIIAAIIAFFAFDLNSYFSFAKLQEQQASLQSFYQDNKWLMIGGFFALYVATASLPVATPLTLAAGAIFGLWTGLLIVSFASSIGGTIAFLLARYAVGDSVQKRFGTNLRAINEGMERDGAFYLFALRLVPAFPFFVINPLMGLTKIKTWTFYWVSQIGMLAGTFVYVNAGTQLASIESPSGIFSPAVIGSFTLLGLFPLIAKLVLNRIKARKAYEGWDKPKSFDNNIIVIGAGSGGLVSALIGTIVKAKVTLIEKGDMGGDCLNTGCVPSKALIRSAKAVHHAKHGSQLGLRDTEVDFEFSDVMERVQRVVKTIEPHDSVERFEGMGVNVIKGEAKITSPWTVEVNGDTISAKNIILATGARPFVPPIPGLADTGYLTSDTLWEIREQPKRLAVLGGGPIGCEMAQSFNRLGTQVIQIEMAPQIMGREDPEVADMILQRFLSEGVDVRLGHQAKSVRSEGNEKVITCEVDNETVEIRCDEILVAVGRSARVEGYGLEELGVPLTDRKTVNVNDFLQTNYPNIYAVGDLIGPYQFTHTAAHEAWYAAVNSLFGRFKKFRADYSVVPWATFTDPEVARVGLNETDAKAKNVEYEVSTYDISDLDRAIAEEEAIGLVKVLTVPGKDKILGVTIVGQHAGDLIAEFVLAMKHGLGLNKIMGTIHSYPTLAEANKFVAGQWKDANKPEKLLEFVEKYHAWERA